MPHTTDAIRVLHVDDDPAFAEMVGEFLQRLDEQFVVETATSPTAGMERLREGEIDCVVSDYEMPERTGIAFLESVRERHPELPFILYTGKGSEEVASEAISSGVTDYLQKRGGSEQYAILANRIRNAVRARRSAADAEHRRHRLEQILSTVPSCVVQLDYEGNFVFANERAVEVLGLERTDVTDRAYNDPEWQIRDLDGEPIPDEELPFRQVRDSGTPVHGFMHRIEWPDGTEKVLSVNGAPLFTGEGDGEIDSRDALAPGDDAARDRPVESVVFSLTDVTERLERERELAAEKRRFQALFEATNDAIFVLDPETETIVDANPQAADLLGYSRAELLEEVSISDVHPADGEQYRRFLESVRSAERGRRGDFQCVTKAGTARDCEISASPLDAPDGEYVIATVRDIGERKHREEAIATLHDTAVALSRAASETAVAEEVVDTLAEVLDMPINGVWYHDAAADVLRPAAGTAAAREEVGEMPTFRAGESLAWAVFEAGETARYDDVSRAPGAFNPDTTIRGQVIFPLGEHGVVVAGSTQVAGIDEVDVSLAEVVVTHAESALERLDREARLRTERETVDRLFETCPVAIAIVDADGGIERANGHAESVLGLERSAITDRTYDDPAWGIVDEDGEPLPDDSMPFARVRATGEPVFDVEHGIEWPDGERRWLSVNAAPLTAADGSVESVIAVTKDVTEQRERIAEIEDQNRRLAEFASIVSHDLRNPLNVAQGRLALAREECDSAHLDDVEGALDRSQTLIDDLLVLARQGADGVELDRVALEQVVSRSWENVESHGASLECAVERAIRADGRRLEQLLENLFRNAVEHGGDGVTVTVGWLDDGGFYVADDGPGVSAEERDRIFEPGYSSSPKGTGFGLYIVEEIATAHGWDVSLVESVAGGARFEVRGVEVAAEG